MKMITRRGVILLIYIVLFIFGIIFMATSLVNHSNEWAMHRINHHIYSHGELIGAGKIYDVDGDVLAETQDGKRVYSEDRTTRKSTLHIVGDKHNSISNGVQNIYRSSLAGYSLLYGTYNLDQNGVGNDLTLTIDKDICNVAYEALDGRKGTVGVVNYKTGDIICSVSNPSFDPENIPSDILTNDEYEGAYINRLVSAHYVPGSTFKIVTAICALENWGDEALNRTWKCTGEYQPEKGVAITCEGVHGTIDLEEAFAKSCNAVFSQIAIELGQKKLTATAKELGIGTPIMLSGKIPCFEGKFDLSKADDEIGWTGIGQGNTRLAPMTMLRIASAVANGGSVPSFNIVKSLDTNVGLPIDINLPQNNTQLIDEEVASKVGKLMRNNGKVQYNDVVSSDLNVCAKTGTAQIDEIDDHNIAWFVGYMDDEEYPYAFVVTVENGGSGHRTAAPIANKVLRAIKNR